MLYFDPDSCHAAGSPEGSCAKRMSNRDDDDDDDDDKPPEGGRAKVKRR